MKFGASASIDVKTMSDPEKLRIVKQHLNNAAGQQLLEEIGEITTLGQPFVVRMERKVESTLDKEGFPDENERIITTEIHAEKIAYNLPPKQQSEGSAMTTNVLTNTVSVIFLVLTALAHFNVIPQLFESVFIILCIAWILFLQGKYGPELQAFIKTEVGKILGTGQKPGA